MLNPQYFKTTISGTISVEQLKQQLSAHFRDPDLQNIYIDPKQRLVVAGRVLNFKIELKRNTTDQTVVIGKAHWSRIGIILVGVLLFWPVAFVYLWMSWGAASRFNQGIRHVVESGGSPDRNRAPQEEYHEPPVPAGSSADFLKDLERLAVLREKGALTEDEYTAQKQSLLNQPHI